MTIHPSREPRYQPATSFVQTDANTGLQLQAANVLPGATLGVWAKIRLTW